MHGFLFRTGVEEEGEKLRNEREGTRRDDRSRKVITWRPSF